MNQNVHRCVVSQPECIYMLYDISWQTHQCKNLFTTTCGFNCIVVVVDWLRLNINKPNWNEVSYCKVSLVKSCLKQLLWCNDWCCYLVGASDVDLREKKLFVDLTVHTWFYVMKMGFFLCMWCWIWKESQRIFLMVWGHLCEENQFEHNQKLRGIKATVRR